ncbi:MAG: family 43 glycosylhydrolase, partial [Myxococcota bacterium]
MLPFLLLACVDPARIAAAEASTPAGSAAARPPLADAPAGETGADTAGGWRMARNPVLDGDRPDPHVLRTVEADGAARYWLVSTPGSGADIPVWTSSDLASWELASPGLFGIAATPGNSIDLNGWHYCNVWAPELAELGPDSYMLTFTATRYAEPQAPCPAYAEDGGVYQAWAPRPTGPFLDADRPWEPLPAGAQIGACPVRDTLPRSLDRATVGCVGDECQNVMRLDSTVFVDEETERWWLAYAWYTNAPPLVEWETGNLGEHVSLVELDAGDPFAVRCDAAVPRVHAANPHDALTRARLAESCDGCDTMLDNGRGRYDEAMVRAGHSW